MNISDFECIEYDFSKDNVNTSFQLVRYYCRCKNDLTLIIWVSDKVKFYYEKPISSFIDSIFHISIFENDEPVTKTELLELLSPCSFIANTILFVMDIPYNGAKYSIFGLKNLTVENLVETLIELGGEKSNLTNKPCSVCGIIDIYNAPSSRHNGSIRCYNHCWT